MKRLPAALAVLASLLAAPAARPQAFTYVTTFRAVDAIEVDHTSLRMTGVVEGEAEATTHEFDFAFTNYATTHPYEQRQSCERLALAAMAKPGAYLLVVSYRSTTPSHPSCTLKRATP
jgi:hypothetical protein